MPNFSRYFKCLPLRFRSSQSNNGQSAVAPAVAVRVPMSSTGYTRRESPVVASPQPGSIVIVERVPGSVAIVLSKEESRALQNLKEKRVSPTDIQIIYGDANLDEVVNVIRDVDNYHTFFKSVFISKINNENEVNIVFDMPLWLWDRDYTVRFVESEYDNVIKYTFNAIITDSYPERENTIRLPNFAGSWYMEEIDTNKILVKYTYNCEMLGKFPDWAFSKACGIGCNEVLKGLTGEIERRRWNGVNKKSEDTPIVK